MAAQLTKQATQLTKQATQEQLAKLLRDDQDIEWLKDEVAGTVIEYDFWLLAHINHVPAPPSKFFFTFGSHKKHFIALNAP